MKHRILKWHVYFLVSVLVLVLLWCLIDSSWLGRRLYPFQYQREVFFYSNLHGVDPFLAAAIIYVESRFDPKAESVKGARGLMQIMPETGVWIAESIGIGHFDKERLFEPGISIRMGTWYLSNLHKQFGKKNRAIVLAAYNGGRGQVSRWLEDEIWDGQFSELDSIPFPETRNFVYKVEKVYKRYRYLYSELGGVRFWQVIGCKIWDIQIKVWRTLNYLTWERK